jgi:ribose 5-phosphate isomerase B
MTIALSADHAGYQLMQQLKTYIEDELGHACQNFGPMQLNPDDDYPDLILPAAKAVASGQCQFGIILGGSGQGEAMAANRLKNIRCAVYYGPASDDPLAIIKLAREHNSANMLSLAARFLNFEQAKEAVNVFLLTNFSDEPRHTRRIAKLDNLS